MNFDAKSEILSAIAKTDDQNIKAVLLLLLCVLEFTGDKIDGVSKQLETLLRDEQAMRVAVLNGHEPVHHLHHEWISKKIREEENAAEDSRKIKVGVIQDALKYLVIFALGGGLAWLGLR